MISRFRTCESRATDPTCVPGGPDELSLFIKGCLPWGAWTSRALPDHFETCQRKAQLPAWVPDTLRLVYQKVTRWRCWKEQTGEACTG